jgi:hypothetical protein
MANAILRPFPPYVAQASQNSCWAACLEMWFTGELGYPKMTQAQLRGLAGAFAVGRGGIDITRLPEVIDDATKIGTIKMYTKEVKSATDIPRIGDILNEVGYVYLAFSHPSGLGGHVNLLTGFDGVSTYAVTDPDPGVMRTSRTHQFFFSKFPSFVGWRLTPGMIGLGWTGHAPWDY